MSTLSGAKSSASLMVQSANSKTGSTITRLWTLVYSNGVMVASGYTPLTFVGSPGGTYLVTVSDYGVYSFNHWSSGSTSHSTSVTLAQNPVVLTASYTVS